MKYAYRCPNCNTWNAIDWEDREMVFRCHKCNNRHNPPTPEEQHDAYVDQRNWPQEMGDAVYALRGKNCTVPGCNKRADTLDHRVAWNKGGKTSVENLHPMCQSHNSSKGDENYGIWLIKQNLTK